VVAKARTRLNGLAAELSERQRQSNYVRIVTLFMWPIISLVVILAKLIGSLNWSWIIVLAPIWLPLFVFSILLLGAMWLDQLNS